MEPKPLGHTLERMRSSLSLSLSTDVSVGTAASPHDIIQRFPWYPLIGCPEQGEGEGDGGGGGGGWLCVGGR